MATSQKKTNHETPPADASEVKRKLAWRMGLAGLMIVGLLGALALFDRLSAPDSDEPQGAPQFTEPVPVAKKVITQPVTPAEPAVEPAKEATPPPPTPAAAPEATSAPVDKAAPRAERPARAEAPAQAAPSSPSAPAAAARPAPARTAPPAPAGKSAGAAARPEAAPRSEAPAAEPPSPPRLFSGYALQAGVFSDPRRAEELHARLVLEGIPATIESRVQVGPFKDRAEAEAAREKMKAMGIDSVLLPPRGAKR